MSTVEAAHHGTGQSPSEAFSSVLNAAVASAAAKLERTADSWTDKLNDVAGGPSPPRPD